MEFSSLNDYINGVLNNTKYSENENLTPDDKYNDLIITMLRTKWGIDINLIAPEYIKHFNKQCDKFIKENYLKKVDNNIILTPSGIFISDYIMRELMI